MATWEQIKDIRLRINDPEGVINITSVATINDLPAEPEPYTYYYVESSGAYVSKESGDTEYSTLDISISDTRIGQWIDANGADYAECMSYQAIAGRLGKELLLKKAQAGAESTEYQSLNDMYRYYKSLHDDCEKRRSSDTGYNAGRYADTKNPEIAGGNL